MTDCSDILDGAGILIFTVAAVSFVLGWWINKATMLESLYRESKKVQAAPAGKEGNNGAQ